MTDKPCKRCGGTERHKNGRSASVCAVCKRARQTAGYAADRVSRAAVQRNRNALDPDFKAKRRAYRDVNRERLCALERERRAANPEKFRLLQRNRRATNIDKFRSRRRSYYAVNAEKFRDEQQTRRISNPEKAREIKRGCHRRKRAAQNLHQTFVDLSQIKEMLK